MKESLTFSESESHLRTQKPYMERQYHVKEIGIFGSYVQGKLTKRSDVDILVDFSHTISALRICRLKDELTQLLGRKVDLVSK